MWPIQLDLSRISYAALRGAVAPILPGGLVALGCMFVRDGPTERLISNPSIGYYTKIAIVVFAAYVVGFVIHIGGGLASAIALGLLKERLRGRLYPGEPQKDKQWRALARRFIGEDLVPAVDQPLDKPPSANDTPQFRAIMETAQQATKGIMDEYEWSCWYRVMLSYFYKVDRSSFIMLLEFSMLLESIGWAGVILLKCAHASSFLRVAGCVLVILAGLAGCFVAIVGLEVQPANLVADMLHELKQESRHRATPNT